MLLNRRELLWAGAGAIAAAALPRTLFAADSGSGAKRMGVGTHSYSARLGADRNKPDAERFLEPNTFLDYCHALGAGGIQVALGQRDAEYCKKLRDRAAAYNMYLEGSVALPKDKADVERLEGEVRTAREMGAMVLRTTMLSGRRYETFNDLESFQQFADRSYQWLTMAEPVLARHGVRLAIENHKDWRIEEFLPLLKRLGSQQIGILIDTGNSISLAEDPWEVVDAYAPYANSVHIKDMAVAEYDDGFLLSEVPIGRGFLDMPRMVKRVREARPDLQFTLEMITRDPLQVPCKTAKYWVTMEHVPPEQRERHMAMIRQNASKQPLPKISQLSQEEKFKVEDDNVRECLAAAHKRLGL